MASVADMKILHIGCIGNSLFNGVHVAVPSHVNYQGKSADTAFLNIASESISAVENQIDIPWSIEAFENVIDVQWRPDLVVFHEVYRVDYLSAAKMLNKKGIPYIVIPHGELSAEAQKKKWMKKKIANIFLFGNFVSNALAIQCLSPAEQANLVMGKTSFVGTNGVEIPSEQKKSFKADGRHGVYIGRLDAFHKGLDIMIDAIASNQTLCRETATTFSIYGPDYQGRFDNVTRLIKEGGVEDIFSLNHEVSGNEKKAILLNADFFMQTSRFEGMPLGVLEAMSYGLPCLVTKGTNLADVIGSSGSGFVADTNTLSVSQVLNEAITCDVAQLSSMGTQARETVIDNFSWDKVARLAVERYRLLLDERN